MNAGNRATILGWGTRAALAVITLVGTADLAIRLAFSPIAVQAKVSHAIELTSGLAALEGETRPTMRVVLASRRVRQQ
jgi:hypothetical protein